MKIERIQPPPPPREFLLTLTYGECWVIVDALNKHALMHPYALSHIDWKDWAGLIAEELRRSDG